MQQYRLIITVNGVELPTEVYFKQQAVGDLWLKHHYLIISQLVWLLAKSRDLAVEVRRTL